MCLNEITNNISNREHVAVEDLEYIGVTDASMLHNPRMVHQFIIRDANHPRYKTTVAWTVPVRK